MNLERQLNNLKSVADEDCCSLLADVTERANEVVPVQHRQRIRRLIHRYFFLKCLSVEISQNLRFPARILRPWTRGKDEQACYQPVDVRD
jgi:hypothetical protein